MTTFTNTSSTRPNPCTLYQYFRHPKCSFNSIYFTSFTRPNHLRVRVAQFYQILNFRHPKCLLCSLTAFTLPDQILWEWEGAQFDQPDHHHRLDCLRWTNCPRSNIPTLCILFLKPFATLWCKRIDGIYIYIYTIVLVVIYQPYVYFSLNLLLLSDVKELMVFIFIYIRLYLYEARVKVYLKFHRFQGGLQILTSQYLLFMFLFFNYKSTRDFKSN